MFSRHRNRVSKSAENHAVDAYTEFLWKMGKT